MARPPNGLQRHAQTVRARRFTPLRRAVRLPVWGDLGLRLGAALFLISIVVLIHWFGLEDIEHTLDHGTDLEAVSDGFIAVTPLQLDLTHHSSIGALAERYAA